MNCPGCRQTNPEHAKFCMQCGAALTVRCPNCSTELPAGARFCMECGHQLGRASASDEARLGQLAAATPAPLAEKLRATQPISTRRPVTALFADVVGSTALAERLDAEDWTAIMNRAFERFSPTIYRYEGTIARLLGDALLAFFGAPVAQEDHQVRAVRAALDLLAVAREHAEEVRRTYGVGFAVRVGLNTGEVVFGAVGSDLKYEHTAIGDAVNLAARLQSAARPMTALISEQTYGAVAPLFECADLGPLMVKGKAEPVRVYEVLRPKAEPGRVRGLAGLASPMVGREAELRRLIEASDAVRAGRGAVAVVVGEPGLGKSRLIAEWRAADAATPVPLRWYEGHCLSYGQGLAYHLLIDLLRSLVGVSGAAAEPETRATLASLTDDLFGGESLEVYPYLANLLGLRLDGAALERVRLLDPETLQGRYLTALKRLLHALVERGPVGLILDDIHWADPSSVELLIKLLPLALKTQILLCFVTRPDRDAPGWRIVTAARETPGLAPTEVALQPLTDDDSRRLIANLLEIEALPEQIRTTILRKAEGNPFFVEEVIRMLIDRGALSRDGDRWAAGAEIGEIEVPDNLQGLLLARIDRLPEDVKRTLRVASVIGRQFSVRVLERVLELQGAV